MKNARKWIFEKREYIPVEIPDTCTAYHEDMDAIVTCPICGKSITYGESYTSRTIHTDHGMGYAVCSQCYGKELEEGGEFH